MPAFLLPSLQAAIGCYTVRYLILCYKILSIHEMHSWWTCTHLNTPSSCIYRVRTHQNFSVCIYPCIPPLTGHVKSAETCSSLSPVYQNIKKTRCLSVPFSRSSDHLDLIMSPSCGYRLHHARFHPSPSSRNQCEPRSSTLMRMGKRCVLENATQHIPHSNKRVINQPQI